MGYKVPDSEPMFTRPTHEYVSLTANGVKFPCVPIACHLDAKGGDTGVVSVEITSDGRHRKAGDVVDVAAVALHPLGA